MMTIINYLASDIFFVFIICIVLLLIKRVIELTESKEKKI